jgi:hypothetical protein
MPYTAIHSEGALIPEDILDQIIREELPGQKAADFGFPKGTRLGDEIARAWSDAYDYWRIFGRHAQDLPEGETGATLTRERWMALLLNHLLGYELAYQATGAVVDGQTFPISHRAGPGVEWPPVHIAGFREDLDRRPATGHRRLSPQALVQEYLNRTEDHLWGIVSNGHLVRLLRQTTRASRPSYLEFDLRSLLNGQRYNEFALFFRLCHRTRLPRPGEDPHKCLLEDYFQKSIEQGGRVRDRLRDGVEKALRILGSGFLAHPQNTGLTAKIQAGNLTAVEFHRQLLRLVYRLLFLMVAEERRMIVPDVAPGFSPARAAPSLHSGQALKGGVTEDPDRFERIYRDYYSIGRLRQLAEHVLEESPYGDLWQGLKQTFRLFSDVPGSNPLGIPPLNGELFNSGATRDLNDTHLLNHDLIRSIRHLSLFEHDKVRQRINYAALDVEELGSVYESLLDFEPVITPAPACHPERSEGSASPEPQSEIPHSARNDRGLAVGEGALVFDFRAGTTRKSTGSYYTRPELVAELIQSALVPVLEERVRGAATREEKEHAILNMKVCDPASGSGHFLLAAARRMGRELAKVRTGEEEPTPKEFHLSVRDVIAHCLYAVDKNPLAVDLCKVALWLEGHHRVKCGDSLVGVFDPEALQRGIPDEAFNPVTGDDKKVAGAFKKRNKRERESPTRLLPFDQTPVGRLGDLAHQYAELGAVAENSPADVKRKAELYARIYESPNAHQAQRAANLWTAAFFVSLTDPQHPLVPTTERLWEYMERPNAAYAPMIGVADSQGLIHKFFHWPLEFPEVFAEGGFDVVVGNPPWERIKLQEEEFFATRDPEIAKAPNKAARQKLIDQLPTRNPALAMDFYDAKRTAEASGKFARTSGRFPLTAVGDINTYALFAGLARWLLNSRGRAGIIVPTGIATDDTYKDFFADLNEKHRLASLYDFENREALFPDVDSRMKFSLLTMSAKPVERADFAFFSTRTEHLRDPQRRFALTPEDFALLSPNTRTCPVFRTRADAELTKAVYQRLPVLVNEHTGQNPWGVAFTRVFDMNKKEVISKARLTEDVAKDGAEVKGPFCFSRGQKYLPIYEGKMFGAFNHRAASVFLNLNNIRRAAQSDDLNPEELQKPGCLPIPAYWIPESEVREAIGHRCQSSWVIVYKNVTAPTNERTMIATVLPHPSATFSVRCVFLSRSRLTAPHFLSNLNSLPFDYLVRQSLSGLNLSDYIVKQLPAIPTDSYGVRDQMLVVPRILELIYTAWDIKAFADDVWRESDESLRQIIRCQWQENKIATGGHEFDPPEWAEIAEDGIPLAPFKWDENRRTRLRAELDAYYALLYGLNRKQLRYILDPADLTRKELEDILDPWEEVTDPLDEQGYRERAGQSDFPGETFRVLKEKELARYGEYRTRRLVLDAYEELAKSDRFIGEKRESAMDASNPGPTVAVKRID